MFKISLQKNKRIEIEELQYLDDEAVEKINFNFFIQKMLKIKPQSEVYEIVVDYSRLLRATINFKVANSNDAEFDFFALKFYSKKNDIGTAIQYFIDEIHSHLLSAQNKPYKLIIEENIAGTSFYFLIEKKQSTYYGFIDNEKAHEPQLVGIINTQNLIYFLEAIKKIIDYSLDTAS